MPKKGRGRRNTFEEVPCIIGIDQSYTRTGISIATKGKPRNAFSIDFKGLNTKTQKRLLLQSTLRKVIETCLKKYDSSEITIIAEKIRTFTETDSLRVSVIKAHSALMAYIVDTAAEYGIKVFSVDTRAWKSRVLGTSKPVFEPLEGVENPQKFGSVRKAIKLGFGEQMKVKSCKTRSFRYDDDMADAICISLYGFSGYPYTLSLEQ